ncbi:MAG: hypothetical protein H7239_05570 [Flavobacterium sp.]|nr:hypothetical protein [Flavobacterium sp.]
MKNLFLAVIISLGITSYAQENQERQKKSPEERTEKQVESLIKELALNQKQVVQVKQLLFDQEKKREELKAKFKATRTDGVKPTPEQRAEMKKIMQDNQNAFKTSMKNILTADQYTKWEQKLEEKKDKMKERMGDRMRNKGISPAQMEEK